MSQPSLFDPPPDAGAEVVLPDRAARDFAVDPVNDVVLEASAGTGKTRVLVERYVRLIEAGVDPRHILAMTFTRKAAAEMRQRVLVELRRRAANGAFRGDRWRDLQQRIADIQISTIDAFCFGLLREFPLEADVDPAFDIADETEMARFANEALDLTMRAVRGLLVEDERVRLLFARVKLPVLRDAIASLLDRRQVALPALATFVTRQTGGRSAEDVGRAFIARLRETILRSPHRSAIVDDGPHGLPEFRWLAADLAGLDAFPADDPARVQQLRRRVERHFLTKDRKPRKRLPAACVAAVFATPDARKRHEKAVASVAETIRDHLQRLDADIDVLLARGLLRVVSIAVDKYEALLTEHALLDFAGMLDRSVALLERQEEFARSRLKLQGRYHHILVDEFQDTSRRQWQLIDLLVQAWGEGEGTADAPTSIFIVGDRKQSIYRFRHAEVTLLDEAARRIGALRPYRQVRQAITASFRAVPELQAFVNALAMGIRSTAPIDERFDYDERDRFPLPQSSSSSGARDGGPVLGLIAERTMTAAAAAAAEEIRSLLGQALVRDRTTGLARPAREDDIAILFRARTGHQFFEEALEARGVRTYVYKGLGFFDAPEVQDLQAFLRYLARPDSDIRAAEFLRSRFVRLSDVGLVHLAPGFARALQPSGSGADDALGDRDRALLQQARASLARWRARAGRVPPSELVDLIVSESAYLFELRGRRLGQARENVKKVRALLRRVENRGYATLDWLASYFDTLRAGDESNAIVEASGAVSLMTIHAAKGLEFPIVFVVNLQTPGRGRPAGFSIIERGPDGQPDVAFGTSEATKLEDLREQEELRRLLYVAVTRARDRLYLAAEIDERSGKLERGTRSLAALLPASLADIFASAAASPQDVDEVEWVSDEGRFPFRVCRAVAAGVPRIEPPAATVVETRVRPAWLQPMERGAIPATADDAAPATSDARPAGIAATVAPSLTHETDERLLGTLVHRLFQRQIDPEQPDAALEMCATALLRTEERVNTTAPRELARGAASRYRALRARSDLLALLAAGEAFYEVPFSYAPPDRPGTRIRGFVDCLVVAADGSATVIELKTGHPRPEHQRQADVYARAMAAALGIPRVATAIVYAALPEASGPGDAATR